MKDLLIKKWRDLGLINDEKVFKAFAAVQREQFVLAHLKSEAYCDAPLRIGFEQTISQPLTVLVMTELLSLNKTDKVLEVGAGSGYAAAIISQLSNQVFATEIIPQLARQAQKNLAKAKIDNVTVVQCDGSQGYTSEAPYDKIIVSAACSEIHQVLIEQLTEGGIIVAPVGGCTTQVMTRGIRAGQALKESHFGT